MVETQEVTGFFPDVLSYNDYYPYGMLTPGRHASDESYRYGFQGQEKDDELKGEGNSLNYKYRMHDPRIGRFFAVDPLAPKYPHYTPYQFSGNKVIRFVELEGLQELDAFLSDEHIMTGLLEGEQDGTIKPHYEHYEPGIIYTSVSTIFGYLGEAYNTTIGNPIRKAISYSVSAAMTSAGWEFGKSRPSVSHNDIYGPHLDSATAENNLYMSFAFEIQAYGDATPEVLSEAGALMVEFAIFDGLLSTESRIGRVNKVKTKTKNYSGFDYGDLCYDIQIEVYHKGELANGKVSSGVSLSTGTDITNVSALNRSGDVHTFSIPEEVFNEWKSKGLIEKFQDFDFETGVMNEEIRFSPEISGELNKYKINKSGNGG